MLEITKIFRRKVLVLCTACRYCMPCPSGVNIPGNFATINTMSLNSSNKGMDIPLRIGQRIRYLKRAKSKKQLEKRPNNGRASLCVNCGICVEKCPQHIAIPEELVKVVAVMEKRKLLKNSFPKTAKI